MPSPKICFPQNLFETLMRSNLTNRERRLVDAIIHRTFGCGQKEAELSTKNLADLTGIKKPNLLAPLRGLTADKVVVVSPSIPPPLPPGIDVNTTPPRKYRINLRYYEWKRKRGVSPSIPPQGSPINRITRITRITRIQPYRFKSPCEIPPDFEILPEMEQWFLDQNFQFIEIKSATDEFFDYWRSVGKKKKDWLATWRNGMRNKEKWCKSEGKEKDSWRLSKS